MLIVIPASITLVFHTKLDINCNTGIDNSSFMYSPTSVIRNLDYPTSRLSETSVIRNLDYPNAVQNVESAKKNGIPTKITDCATEQSTCNTNSIGQKVSFIYSATVVWKGIIAIACNLISA